MAKIEIYTTSVCPYCVAAKKLLNARDFKFEEINLSGEFEKLAELKNSTGLRTVPQIFINDQLIGGFNELSALDQSGELDKLLD